MNRCTPGLLAAVFVALLLSTLQLARRQTADAPRGHSNLSHRNQFVTVARQGYTISGFVSHVREAKAFKYGVALFWEYAPSPTQPRAGGLPAAMHILKGGALYFALVFGAGFVLGPIRLHWMA